MAMSKALTLAQLEAEFRQRDLVLIRRCLPAHMMYLMMEEASKTGWTMRADMLHRLSNAAGAPLARLDPMDVSRLAKRIDDHAGALLRDLSSNDSVEGLFTCAMFAMVLVDEGYLQDRQNMAVLVALLLLDDAKSDSPDVEGVRPEYAIKHTLWMAGAKKMLGRAVFMGIIDRYAPALSS